MDKSKFTNGLSDGEMLDKDFLKGKDLSNQTEYGRPPVNPDLSDRTCDITFMQIDCDYHKSCKCSFTNIS